METKQERLFFRRFQQQELDGGALYAKIAGLAKEAHDREVLFSISRDEYRHAQTYAKYSGGAHLRPNRLKVLAYAAAARILGYTFVIKLLENGEDRGIRAFRGSGLSCPEYDGIFQDENRHEAALMEMLDEERLRFLGEIVLGMNDALVELTGSLAGYTFAMQNTKVIAMAGLITGISATLSMAASGFLSARAAGAKDASKSSLYTGIAYLVTIVLLILPYLLFPAQLYLGALGVTLLIAVAVIAGFNFYVSVARDKPFRRGFLEMACISLGVAAISFGVGIVVKNVLGIDL
mgnify:CR=1 FL=1